MTVCETLMVNADDDVDAIHECDNPCPITAPVSRIRDLQLLADLLFPFNKYPLCQLASEHMALSQPFGIILTLSTALASIACAFTLLAIATPYFGHWSSTFLVYKHAIYTHLLPDHPAHVCVFL